VTHSALAARRSRRDPKLPSFTSLCPASILAGLRGRGIVAPDGDLGSPTHHEARTARRPPREPGGRIQRGRDGRVVEGAPLLRVYGSKAHRGFESLSLRQLSNSPAILMLSAALASVGPHRLRRTKTKHEGHSFHIFTEIT